MDDGFAKLADGQEGGTDTVLDILEPPARRRVQYLSAVAAPAPLTAPASCAAAHETMRSRCTQRGRRPTGGVKGEPVSAGEAEPTR